MTLTAETKNLIILVSCDVEPAQIHNGRNEHLLNLNVSK